MNKPVTYLSSVVLIAIIIAVGFLAAASSRMLYTTQCQARADEQYSRLSDTFVLLSRLEEGDEDVVKAILRIQLAERLLNLERDRGVCDDATTAQIEVLYQRIASHLVRFPLTLDNKQKDATARRILGLPPVPADKAQPASEAAEESENEEAL